MDSETRRALVFSPCSSNASNSHKNHCGAKSIGGVPVRRWLVFAGAFLFLSGFEVLVPVCEFNVEARVTPFDFGPATLWQNAVSAADKCTGANGLECYRTSV